MSYLRSATASKNLNLTPFDVISRLLGKSTFRSTTFNDKTDLYFQDYSLIPLFVQVWPLSHERKTISK
jgi:hypothetical protein